MKSKRYSVEQVVAALKQHELGTPEAYTTPRLPKAQRLTSLAPPPFCPLS